MVGGYHSLWVLCQVPTHSPGDCSNPRPTFWEGGHIKLVTMKVACVHSKSKRSWTSLVVQGLGVCLPMQGAWVRSLVWEKPTRLRATKPVHHIY